jgi:hypothetical protein
LKQFYFNFQVNYALGIRNLGEVYLAERTLYEFRERVYRHILEYPEQDEVIFQQFEILTKNFIEQAGIKTDDQRMDSTLISPNIKKAGRLSLALDVLVQAVRGIASNMLSDNLKQVLRDSFRTDLLYRTRNQELESRFQKVLNLMQEVDNLANKDRNLASKREMVLLKRFLGEQAAFDESKGIWLAKPSSEIESGSLQSAYDSDATFRNKAGKNHSGYVLNVSETSSKENPIQVITDFSVQPNNISEVGDISRFQDPRQIQKLAGFNLVANSSGKHKGKTTISKRGRKRLRHSLFFAMIAILAHNPEFRSLHQRNLTRENNPLNKMQSIIALCRKLIRIFYALLNKGFHCKNRLFNPYGGFQ